MKTNWQAKKLGDLCQIELGKTPYRGNKEFWDIEKQTNNVWLSIADLLNGDNGIVSDSEEYVSDKGADICKIVKIGTLLASFKLTLGRLAFAGRDLYTNEAIAALSIKDPKHISKNYLYHYLNYFDWHAATKGDVKVKGKTLNKAKLKEIIVYFPSPIAEQDCIVGTLDKAFDLVIKAKENSEKNLQNAREIFESYLQSIFANPGEGWEEKKLREVLQKTEAINPTQNPEKEFIYIDVSSVNNKHFIIENTTLLKGINAPSRARKLVKKGDVIFATVRPTLRRIAIIPKEYDEQVCSTGYFVLRAKEYIDNKLLFYFLLTNRFNERMEKLQKGASYPAVTDNEVREQIIHYPKTLAEQRSIIFKLDALSAETKKLESIYQQKLSDLEELKKSVLHKAFNGELAGVCS